jgi:hypothetical protein
MNLNILDEDIVYYLLSKCSIASIIKLYNANKRFISEEMLNLIINNRWAIKIGTKLSNSILKHEYLDFDKDVSKALKPPISITSDVIIHNYNICSTNSILLFKYNNIENKDVAFQELFSSYDYIYKNNNPTLSKYINANEVEIFKGLVGGTFDLNILAYVNLYNIYEVFKSCTFGKLSVFKEKCRDSFIKNFDSSTLDSFTLSLLSSLRSAIKISSKFLEKKDDKQISLLNLNKNEIGLKYLNLLITIFDNCTDLKYYKFKIYIAVQICKFIRLFFKDNYDKHATIKKSTLDKMLEFKNNLEFNYDNTYDFKKNVPGYLYFYATFEMSFILSNVA